MVVACTNIEPTQLVADGRLRSDLFARLRVHTIVIPPLRERREDIPALLAFLAGGAIQIDLAALTALILHDHPLNIRGLLALVERARRRQSLAAQSSTSGDAESIRILKDDLDNELIRIANDLFRASAGSTEESDILEFRVECPDPRLGQVFEQAAEILSSYQLTAADAQVQIIHRPREARFDSLWESAKRERSAARTNRKEDAEEELVNRWLDLISDLERTLGQQPETLQQTLDTAANLFRMRWAQKGDQTYVKRLLALKNTQRRARKTGISVQTRHLAASLGTTSSALDNLITKRRGNYAPLSA